MEYYLDFIPKEIKLIILSKFDDIKDFSFIFPLMGDLTDDDILTLFNMKYSEIYDYFPKTEKKFYFY